MFAHFQAILHASPLLSRFAVLLALLLTIGGGFAYWQLHGSLPAQRLVLSASELDAAVSIVRDEHGVPFIEAKTDNDAFFAIGYVHAQDRLWQLEVQRRMIHGELSELFGHAAVQQDIWFRTLGVYAAAQAAWPGLSNAAKNSLARYTAGINAGVAAHTRLPVEFGMLGVAPGRWTDYDTLAWIKMFALSLGENSNLEMARHAAGQVLTPAQLQTFFPNYPAAVPGTRALLTQDASLTAYFDFQQGLAHQLRLGAEAIGSNAWAVSGRLSASGAALLANDPHLGLQMPSPWYVVRAKGERLDVAGMSLVGLPFVVFGRNASISWGGTNMMADAQDLYIERADTQDGGRYEVNGEWQKFTSRVELIHIRTAQPEALNKAVQPVRVLIRATRHGPLISDQYRVFERPVALRWVGLEPNDTSYEAFFRLQFAADWAGFNEALALHVAPALNMVYADRGGNIGYLGAGRVPVRKSGRGLLPVPGWNDDYRWTGYIPSAAMPRDYNPAAGFIVSANHQAIADSYPYFISADWASPARAQRITELLQERIASGQALNLADMQRMQADTVDHGAAQLVGELLKHVVPRNTVEAAALKALGDWRGDMAGASQAAAIYQVWTLHLRRRLFGTPLRGYWNKPDQAHFLADMTERVSETTLTAILAKQDTPWCGPRALAAREACDTMVQASLQSALEDLTKLSGSATLADWRWDRLQTAVYSHRPFSDVKPLNALFERKVGTGGSRNTINVAAGTFTDKEGYAQQFGASFRQVFSMGQDAVVHDYMNSTGQSGNVVSSHYADMVEPFHRTAYFPLGNAPHHDQRPRNKP